MTVLAVANTATALPLPSREKPNALGFHQHQPKSSQHGYVPPSQVADTGATSDEDSLSAPTTAPGRIGPADKPSTSIPALGPGRYGPVDKPGATTSPAGPGRIAPVDKTKSSPPEGCMTQHMGDPESVPWGCAVRKPPKQIPEPGTPALLAVALSALWLVRFARRRCAAGTVRRGCRGS